MTVTYDQFYQVFVKSNPNLIYFKEFKDSGMTLDNLLGHGDKLVVKGPRQRDLSLKDVEDKIMKRHFLGVYENTAPFQQVVFLDSECDSSEQKYIVCYCKRALNYFNDKIILLCQTDAMPWMLTDRELHEQLKKIRERRFGKW